MSATTDKLIAHLASVIAASDVAQSRAFLAQVMHPEHASLPEPEEVQRTSSPITGEPFDPDVWHASVEAITLDLRNRHAGFWEVIPADLDAFNAYDADRASLAESAWSRGESVLGNHLDTVELDAALAHLDRRTL